MSGAPQLVELLSTHLDAGVRRKWSHSRTGDLVHERAFLVLQFCSNPQIVEERGGPAGSDIMGNRQKPFPIAQAR